MADLKGVTPNLWPFEVWRRMENVFPNILGFFGTFSDKTILILFTSGLGLVACAEARPTIRTRDLALTFHFACTSKINTRGAPRECYMATRIILGLGQYV